MTSGDGLLFSSVLIGVARHSGTRTQIVPTRYRWSTGAAWLGSYFVDDLCLPDLRLPRLPCTGGSRGANPAMAPPKSLEGGQHIFCPPPKTTLKNHKSGVFGITIHTYAGGSRGHFRAMPLKWPVCPSNRKKNIVKSVLRTGTIAPVCVYSA